MSDAGLFVTGAYRSGTTLLDKILSNHPKMKVASQPFPFLLFHLKNRFYQSLGIERIYPLTHLFQEEDYRVGDFTRFLQDYRLDDTEVQGVFNDMKGYFGHWTPGISEFIPKMKGGDLKEVLNGLLVQLKSVFNSPNAAVMGFKEIFGEEYIPYLLDHGYSVILIIRDPRSIIASLNYGKGNYYTGEIRPVLHTVRSWRKSVAFGLEYQSHPNLLFIRFEDLINNFSDSLDKMSYLLNIEHFKEDTFIDGIHDQFGNPWHGNSSFTGHNTVSRTSLDKYKLLLDPATVSYIESTCMPELKLLNYETTISDEHEAIENINSYIEPFEIKRTDFSRDYSYSTEARNLESTRLNLLSGGFSNDADIENWFIFKNVFEQLKSVR